MSKIEDTIREKIPTKIRAEDLAYGNLLSYVKTFNILKLDQLKTSIKEEIDTCNAEIQKNKGPTNNRIAREYARKASHFKKMQKLIDKYL